MKKRKSDKKSIFQDICDKGISRKIKIGHRHGLGQGLGGELREEPHNFVTAIDVTN